MLLGAEHFSSTSQLASGPIFLDNLLCEEADDKLQECDFGLGIHAIGLTTCNHSHDVWLRCRGMYVCIEL